MGEGAMVSARGEHAGREGCFRRLLDAEIEGGGEIG